MDFLKWLLKACFILALMFLGLKAEPKHKPSDKDTAQNYSTYSTGIHHLLN